MAIDYEIEPGPYGWGIVRTLCSGEVDFAQVLEHFQVLEADPARPDRLDVLLDLTPIESLPDRGQVRGVTQEMASLLPAVGWGCIALVAHSDVGFGVARMLGTLLEEVFEETMVFRVRDEAEQWLTARQRGR